ncbi:MAG: hypothetical protein M3349_07665 [Actinomycetota bacterium]|nr:hypothetical protein [Actinomycetota bacterium]
MFDQLARSISVNGIGQFEDEVAAFVTRAVRRGAPPVLVSVLSDRSSPEVARERAFGRLAAFLARPDRPAERPAA